jgi:thiol-disulfide isomerase/thioredoxin
MAIREYRPGEGCGRREGEEIAVEKCVWQTGVADEEVLLMKRAISRWLTVAAGLLLFVSAAHPQGRVIYPPPSRAKADLAAAIRRAEATHKRVLVDFGGNWCGDCIVLDIYMHREPNKDLLARNYEMVHVNIGRYDKNLDLAQRFGIPLSLGVPALAVLSPRGKLIFSQSSGQFEKMQQLDPDVVTQFLIRWKPIKSTRPGCSVVRVNC